MPRGRHRHSQPLHRMLPPLTVAGCAAALAATALFAGDTAALRVIAVAAALTAGAGAALARGWDRSAGRSVAELEAARVRDEWHAEERVAEAETDLEESREIRGRLEKKLRAKRAELARLRTEHAELLRRYATAESERARALEARRRLQLEGAAARAPLALTTGPSPIGPAAFLKAGQALRDLPRNAARQQAQATVEHARRREAAAPDEPQGRHASGGAAETAAGLPVRQHRNGLVPAVAAAVLPYAQRSHQAAGHRAIGGFDFFGTQRTAGEPEPGHEPHPGSAPEPSPDRAPQPAAGPAPETRPAPDHEQRDEHRDERGDEQGREPEHEHGHAADLTPGATAAAPAPAAAPAAAPAPAAGPGVIDLTAHDDTEQLDVTELRAKA